MFRVYKSLCWRNYWTNTKTRTFLNFFFVSPPSCDMPGVQLIYFSYFLASLLPRLSRPHVRRVIKQASINVFHSNFHILFYFLLDISYLFSRSFLRHCLKDKCLQTPYTSGAPLHRLSNGEKNVFWKIFMHWFSNWIFFIGN